MVSIHIGDGLYTDNIVNKGILNIMLFISIFSYWKERTMIYNLLM